MIIKMAKILTFIIMALLLSEASYAFSNSDLNLKFKKYFTDDVLNFTADRVVKLDVSMKGLPPKKHVQVELSYGVVNGKNKTKLKTRRVKKSGELKFSKSLMIRGFNLTNKKSPKTFTAIVTIKDKSGSLLVRKYLDLLVLPRGNDPVYKVNSLPICRWQTGTQIDSEFYVNQFEDKQSITIRKSFMISRGIELNLGADAGVVIPVSIVGTGPGSISNPLNTNPTTNPTSASPFNFSNTSVFVGSSYSSRSEKRDFFELSQTWELFLGQAGFTIDRVTFSRYNVIKYKELAGLYKPVEQGTLDVGTNSQSFVSVPMSMISTPEKLIDFVDLSLPLLNTCKDLGGTNSDHLIVPNENIQLLYRPYGVVL